MSSCADNIPRARELLTVAKPEGEPPAAAVDRRSMDKSACWDRHCRHRSLRARRNASSSADSSTHRRQARHLMTASQCCKSRHRTRQLSTGHGRAGLNPYA
jgi:hypothetical protein